MQNLLDLKTRLGKLDGAIEVLIELTDYMLSGHDVLEYWIKERLDKIQVEREQIQAHIQVLEIQIKK